MMPVLRIFVMITCVAVLGACGVKSAPRSPTGTTYPRHYPKPLPTVQAKTEKPREGKTPVYDSDSFYQYPNRPPEQ